MENEEWKVMDELDGKYSVSNYGQIKHNRTGNIRKQQVNAFGYNRMSFHITRKKIITYFVHRLVAKYFIKESKKPFVNHIDGNKINNHLTIKNMWRSRGKMHNDGYISQGQIAKRFNVSRGLIGHIVNNRAWKYLCSEGAQ